MNIYTNPQSHPAFPGVPGPAPGLKSNVYINPYMLHSKLFKELLNKEKLIFWKKKLRFHIKNIQMIYKMKVKIDGLITFYCFLNRKQISYKKLQNNIL